MSDKASNPRHNQSKFGLHNEVQLPKDRFEGPKINVFASDVSTLTISYSSQSKNALLTSPNLGWKRDSKFFLPGGVRTVLNLLRWETDKSRLLILIRRLRFQDFGFFLDSKFWNARIVFCRNLKQFSLIFYLYFKSNFASASFTKTFKLWDHLQARCGGVVVACLHHILRLHSHITGQMYAGCLKS